ncbi:MAG: pyrroloquinoline quinone biosynthesis protein PqqE, partial [Gluconobacter sp.]
ALTGNAANMDPVCSRSPFHDIVEKAVEQAETPELVYRRF